LLEGFSLNRNTVFESIVRAPLTCILSRENMTAEVTVPALLPDINFKPQVKHPLYSIEVTLGLVPDLFFSRHGYKPSHKNYPPDLGFVITESPWSSCMSPSESIKLELKHHFTPPDDNFVLILAVGIRFGYPVHGNRVMQAKYAGAARVFKVA
jgi:hypothetical protein